MHSRVKGSEALYHLLGFLVSTIYVHVAGRGVGNVRIKVMKLKRATEVLYRLQVTRQSLTSDES